MAAGPKRRIRVRPVKGFKAVYKSCVKQCPAIKRTMRVFNEVKRKIPSEPLPRGMKDHPLKGKWKGYRECHLAPDVLLIYKQEGDHITLITILGHDALK
jgi:YafQ family addiction module toxin component